MRKVAYSLLALIVFAAPAHAQALGGQLTGFGGTTFGTTSTAPTFGGNLALPLGDNVQIVGEVGRLDDVTASLLADALDAVPFGIGMSAWYGEAGVRFIGSRRSPVRPYAEVTGGVARLRPSTDLDGLAGAITEAGLAFLSRNEPLVGAGAGVIMQGGPFALDLGYRYKRIFADSAITNVFSLGNNGFDVHQVRVGVGFRF
jgi:opacity protein-like surface antigen